MSDREKFEAWWLRDVPENHREFAKKLLDGYGQDYAAAPGVADAWTAWQASRRAALEEAAAHLDGLVAKSNYLSITPEFAARRVRALAEGDKHAD